MSINWIREIVTRNGTASKGYKHPPFFAYIGVHAPHLPSSPAPWYAGTFTDPSLSNRYKTPNYNYSGADHHWCVAQQPPITPDQADGIDALFRDRWRTLLSVDDMVEGLVHTISHLGIEDHCYVWYSSDHGYNLGQLRLTGNKLHAYEQALRIPMYVRGPLIEPGTILNIPGSNTDFAPTWLDFAGVSNNHMDGRSILPHLITTASTAKSITSESTSDVSLHDVRPGYSIKEPWRDFHYAEYNSLGNLWRGGGEMMNGDHLIDDPVSHTYRAIRFVNSSTYGNALYAEYTSLIDWNFVNYSSGIGILDPYSYKFYELFDLDTDPWQVKNIYKSAAPALKQDLHARVESLFKCSGPTCK